MTEDAGKRWTFDQLLYGWSQSNAFGRRGFGIIAMSDGWRSLLSGDEPLGPLVAFPEPGPRGTQAPAHGGFTRVLGRPVLFRRLPSGTDSLNRPGNYCVQMLLPVDVDLTAGAAAALLAGDWIGSGLQTAHEGGVLPALSLAVPGPRRGSAAASGVACGALLQGLSEDRRVVLRTDSEAAGRAALCDAIRRLPAGLGDDLRFSTLEAEPGRFGFDVCVAVAGWAKAGGDGQLIRADLAGDGRELSADSVRWGRALAGTTASSLRGLPEPVNAQSVGLRLDAQAKLADNPARLSGAELISVLSSPEGQAWAAGPIAPGVVRGVVSQLEPEQAAQLAKAAQRRPAVSALLKDVGWDLLAHRSGTAPSGTAQSLLLGLGEPKARIELASLSALDTFTRSDAERYLRLADEPGANLGTTATAAKISWDARLMAAHPNLWFEALLSTSDYQGPRATAQVVTGLTPARVGAAVQAAHRDSPSDGVVAARIWRGLPSAGKARAAFLRTIAGSGDAGLGIVMEHILDQKGIDAGTRASLLTKFWPMFVRELRLPPYLADALEPAGGGRSRYVLAALAAAVVAAFTAGWLLG